MAILAALMVEGNVPRAFVIRVSNMSSSADEMLDCVAPIAPLDARSLRKWKSMQAQWVGVLPP